MMRIHQLSFLVTALTICIFLPAVSVHSQSASTKIEREQATEDVIKMIREEFEKFFEEYKKYTSDHEELNNEKLAMEKKIAELISDLESGSRDPYAAKDELDLWLKTRRMEAMERVNFEVDKKEFGVKVFFGGWAGFFLALAIVFLLLYAFNILQGIYSSVLKFFLDTFGLRSSRLQDRISPASRVDGPNFEKPQRTKSSSSPVAPGSSLSERSLFCFVLTSLINPLVNKKAIEEALEFQKQMDSPPYIGQLLKDRGLISEDEVQKTLQKQKLCRGQKPSSSLGGQASNVFSPRPYLPRR